MKIIHTDWDIPYHNFALEEYLLQEAPPDDYVFFYIHRPSVIVGKFQNTIEEVNQEYARRENLVVARRLSGGGAVYHDAGNLNFSFVHPAEKTDINNFEKFTRPVIGALREMGIPAELSGRNDILVDGRKVSGNAQCYRNRRILHHGTLLYQADMEALSRALQVREMKIASKGIRSVRSRVANLADYLADPPGIGAFRDAILAYLERTQLLGEFVLTPGIRSRLEQRVQETFATWEWNWGLSPRYQWEKSARFPCGLIDVRLNIHRGRIQDLTIYGDFFCPGDPADLAAALRDVPLEREAIEAALCHTPVDRYFQGLSTAEFAEFLTGQ